LKRLLPILAIITCFPSVAIALDAAEEAVQPNGVPRALPPVPGSDAAWRDARFGRELTPARVMRWLEKAHAVLRETGQPDVDILHQDITFEIDDKAQTVKGTIVATLHVNNPGVTQLHFRAEPWDGVLVTYGDLEVPSTLTEMQGSGVIDVALPQALTEATDVTISVAFADKPQCGEVTFLLVPCNFDDQFAYFAFYRYYLQPASFDSDPFTSMLHVRTPIGLMAAAPGIPSGPDDNKDGTVTWNFEQIENTENAGVSVAVYDPKGTPAGEKPFINVYVINDFSDNAKTFIDLGKALIAFFGERFTPFPWVGLNYIQVSNELGGGYAPLGGIFMLRDEFSASPDLDMFWMTGVALVSHETAHQWWGNLVEPSGAANVCLSESLAEFSSCYYTEKTFNSRYQQIQNNLQFVYGVQGKADVPVHSETVYYTSAYVPIVYYKGSIIFDMLRFELGAETMMKGLSIYATTWNRKSAKLEDIQAAMEEAAGQKLDWFFKQWFDTKGYLQASLRATTAPVDPKAPTGKTKLRLRVVQFSKPLRRVTLPVAVDLLDGTTLDTTLVIDPSTAADPSDKTSVTVDKVFDQPILGVRVDRERVLLREWSAGTTGDVNLSGLTDGMDLVDFAFRFGRSIVFTAGDGNAYFHPNISWNEIYDLNQDGKINKDDLPILTEAVGTEAVLD